LLGSGEVREMELRGCRGFIVCRWLVVVVEDKAELCSVDTAQM
jgi:hypothetical protein